ncbi:MAG: oligosaccharide flippase family protein [Pseudomonadota bacterium]
MTLGSEALKKATSPVFVSVSGRILTQVVMAATILVATRFVTLEEFGILALGQAVSVILTSLLYTGLYQIVLRTKNIDEENATLFSTQLVLSATGTLLMISLGLIQAGGSLLQFVFFGLAPVPVLIGTAAHFDALLFRDSRVRAAVLSTAGAEILGFVAMCIAIGSGAGVYALVLGRLVMAILLLIAKVSCVAKWPGFGLEAGVVRGSFAAAYPLYISNGVTMASSYGGDLLLGLFQNPTAVGAFRAASRVTATATEIIAKPVLAISWSNLARSERENRLHALATEWLEQAKFLTFAAWPALIALALLAEPVVNFILDESWGAAAPLITILSLAAGVGILDVLSPPALLCTQKASIFTRLTFARAGITITALLLTAPHGPVAVAYGLLAARAIITPISLSFVLSALNIAPARFARALVPSTIATVTCCLAVVALQGATDDNLQGFMMTGGLAAALWSVIFLFFVTRRVVQLPRP